MRKLLHTEAVLGVLPSLCVSFCCLHTTPSELTKLISLANRWICVRCLSTIVLEGSLKNHACSQNWCLIYLWAGDNPSVVGRFRFRVLSSSRTGSGLARPIVANQ